MLDFKFIRENAELVKKAVLNKKFQDKVNVDEILQVDKRLQEIITDVNNLRQERNEIDDQIKSAGDDKQKQELIVKNTNLKPQIKILEEKAADLQNQLTDLLLLLPNITSPLMPIGESEDNNVVARTWGEIPKFDFEPRDHVDLGEKLDIIDVRKSGVVSGSRFYYLKNEAVLMQFAIIQMVFETLTNPKTVKMLAEKVENPFYTTFVPVIPPVMMRPEIMKKMDRLDPIEDRYELTKDNLILVGSAEHTLGPYHMDETFEESDLPIRYIGYSTAFRREAGSHGKDVRGILRAHQFDKLEMETYVPVEYGQVEQDFIVAIQEHLVQQLKIPYQVIQICTGDTGKPDYNQYDINCWIPSQKLYRETHTSDFMTDFQSRRLNIRYKAKDGSKKFVYMNDATAFAIGRILIAIIENYQQKDGSVIVPEVLRKYTGFESISVKDSKINS